MTENYTKSQFKETETNIEKEGENNLKEIFLNLLNKYIKESN